MAQPCRDGIRPMPRVSISGFFALCRGESLCRGERCTFAHSEAEKVEWNKQLRRQQIIDNQRQSAVVRHVFPLIPPVQPAVHQPDWFFDSRNRHSSGVGCATLNTSSSYAAARDKFIHRLQEELVLSEVEVELTRQNYKEKFHKLLCWEEKRHIEILEERCNGSYKFMKCADVALRESECLNNYQSYGYIDGIDGDKVTYVTQASERAVIIVPGIENVIFADILAFNHSHTEERLYLAFSSDVTALYSRTLAVEFELKHSYFDNLHRAINYLPGEVIQRIVPQMDQFCLGQKTSSMPADQSRALELIRHCEIKSPPVAICGVFGSGKTYLLAEATHELVTKSNYLARILICTHHQGSADTFADQYFARGKPFELQNFFRVTSMKYRLKGQQYCNIQKFLRFANDGSVQVVVTTSLTALRLHGVVPRGFFTHIFLDEAAQAREPEAIAPLCLATEDTKIIMAGDWCQVGPRLLVLGNEARANGLDVSMLQRINRFYNRKVLVSNTPSVTLLKNYRCHSEILELSSALFYNSQLSCARASESHPLAPYPLLFVCSSFDDTVQSCGESSDANEASIVLQQATKFLHKWPEQWKENYCIMTSTKRQSNLIKRMIRNPVRNPVSHHNVNTVYNMQGQEYRALFLSTVEPTDENGKSLNPTKTPCDIYVFNTVLTRAQSLVVCVGNPFLLLKMERHMRYPQKCWAEYLNRCLEHNTIIFPPGVKNGLEKLKRYLKPLTRTAQESASAAPSIEKTHSPSVKRASQHPSAPPNALVPSNLQPVLPSTAGAAKKQTSKKKSAPKVTHSEYSLNVGEEEFPGLEASRKPESKRRKNLQPPAAPVSTVQTTKTIFPHSDNFIAMKRRFEEKPAFDVALSRESYRDKFRHLLILEEEEHERLLKNKCDGIYKLSLLSRHKLPEAMRYPLDEDNGDFRYGSLSGEKLTGEVISYAIQATEDKVSMHITINGHEMEASIVKYIKNPQILYVALHNEQFLIAVCKKAKTAITLDVSVTFILKHTYFNRLFTALDKIPSLSQVLPQESDFACMNTGSVRILHPRFDCLLLDRCQLHALKMIMSTQSSAPLLVVGPFGTGKTRLLASAAYQIVLRYRNARVLICAHHQNSANVFIDKYFGPISYDPNHQCIIKFVRMIPKSKVVGVKKVYRDFCKDTNEVKAMLRCVRRETPHIVVTTLANAIHLKGVVRPGFFTHILIDEGAQTREPECIMPLCLADRSTKVVIAGDHCQVGPALVVLGEEPREHGLNVSLLERLHSLYDKIGGEAVKHCSTLVNNYRCHSGILRLSSSLFYESALQCEVSGDIAHPAAPYPLVFVCSSLDSHIVKEDVNNGEAILVLDQVKKYVGGDNWPEREWGKKSLSDICIITAASNQKQSILKKTNSKKYKEIYSVDVINTYTMQGAEYRAVFLSTSEPMDESGRSLNPTKSVCNRYVFNTAVTRAKSLVVCVGNPFLLLKMEEQSEFKCWKEYLKRCMECSTFYHFAPNSQSAIKELQCKVFDDDRAGVSPSLDQSTSFDSILSAYTKHLEKHTKPGRKLKLCISSLNQTTSWQLCENDATNEKGSQKEFNFKEKLQCHLVVNDLYEAEAIPLDLKKKTVNIIGLNNRRGAFDGDIVEVGVFKDSPRDSQRGKVVGVVEGSRDIRFVCRVDSRDPLTFLPVDRKTPKFKNLPKLSGSIRDEDSIEAELKAKNVVVFDPEWDRESLPKVVDVIPPSTAKNMLFVIKFVCWNLKYRLPLGIAIAALPKSLSIFHSERLLKLAHGIEDDSMSEPYDNISIKQDRSLPLYQNAFTIDPEGAEDLDDAISLELVKSSDESEVYLLGVHIVNVAKHVENGSIVDKYAKNRGISNYWTAEKRKKCRNMLPKEICKGLSLLPNELRDVFTITILCTKKNGQMTFSFSDPEVKRAQIKSQIQLTYKDAQMHMEKQVDISSLETLEKISKLKFCNVLKQLYQIAVQMYKDRLETSSISYSISEEGEEEFWQAHFLIQELMIWANSEVAREIHSKFPCSALLRRQPSPEDEKKAAMVGQHSLVVGYSHSCSLNSLVKTPPLGNMLVMPSTLKQIEEALKKDNMALLSYLLTNDQLYPQMAAASAHLVSIQQRAEYCCTSQDLDAITDFYRHYSLHLASYTHFTSPIRRYIDIEVQRMLIAILNEKTSEECFDLASHKNLCRFLNSRSREAKLFERKMNKTVLALECTSCSIESYAFVTQIHNKSIELSFPQQRIDKILGLKEKKFSLKSLNSLYRKAISSEGSEKKENQKLFTWKIKMTSFESPASIFESVLFSSVNKGELGEDDEGIQLDTFCPAEGEKPGTLKISSYRATAASKVSKIPKTTWMQVKTEAQKLAQSSTPLQATQSPIIHSLLLDHLPKNGQSSQSNSVCKSLSFPLMVYYLKQTINPYDLLKVWITWSLREEVAAPAIQLVELAPFVHICVQHNTHPAECFSDTNLSYASHRKYNSIKEYVGLWEKLLIAESSEKSVKEFQPIIIRDVHLKWPTLEVPANCGDELYYEPNGSVIMKPPAQFMKQSSEFFEMSMGDMVCVRYGVQPESPNKAVYHLVTTAITNKDTGEEVEVEMSFIGKKKRISEQMAKVLRNGEQSPKSEIQLIPMSASYQRIYRRIKTIGQNGHRVSHLCTQVALGIEENRKVESHIKALQILKSDKLARRLWKLDKPLNEVQLEAMELAVENRFQLIQGPPGTGKSETGAHLAYVFQRLNKELNQQCKPNDHWHCVMYCGPSNKSVDVVLRKLDELNEKLQGNRLNILRIYAKVIEKREFGGPESSSSPHQDETADYVCPDYAKRYALHHKIRDGPYGTRIKEYEKEFKSLAKKFVIGSQRRKEYENCIADAKENLLKRERFDIILCTCNEASGKFVEKHVFPRQCIVDECGMTCEPECLSAISLCEHVVLLGDHKQLQHVVDYRPARTCGLNISLFQRYAEHFREKCKTLEIQYRMHQAIQDFPSEHFYGSKLRPGDFVKKREEPKLKNVWPVPTKPIVFCNVVGEEGDNKLWSPGRRKKVMMESKFNSQEAAKAVKIAKALHVDNKIPLDQIAFLTPYSAQEEHLKDVAKEAGLFNEDGGQSVKICSINKSQGDEFGFVILSTVRSQPLELIANPDHIQPDLGWIHENIGFVSDEHQINVGITRSKHGLFIIGNKRLLEYDYTWKKLLGHYEEEGCIVDGFRYPRRSS